MRVSTAAPRRPNAVAAMFLPALIALAGCGSAEPEIPPERQGKMVGVDTKTGEALVIAIAESFPAAHPATGKRTVMPALYCPRCAEWHPVPPPEQINRTAQSAQCPKTKAPLLADGPWPGEEAVADDPT